MELNEEKVEVEVEVEVERAAFLGGLGVWRVVPAVVLVVLGCRRVATVDTALVVRLSGVLDVKLLTMLGAECVATLETRLRLAGCGTSNSFRISLFVIFIIIMFIIITSSKYLHGRIFSILILQHDITRRTRSRGRHHWTIRRTERRNGSSNALADSLWCIAVGGG